MKTLLKLTVTAVLVVLTLGSAQAACTGTSPNLSAPDTGNVTTNGANLSACITAAVRGDTITLTAGAGYVGPFNLIAKAAGTSYITIQSSAIGSLTPGVRVSPSSLSNMAKLLSPTSTGEPAVILKASMSYYKLQGLAFTTQDIYPNSKETPGLLATSESGDVTYGLWPDHLTIDRCLFYAGETDPLPYRSADSGVAIDGSNITITNSYMYNFMGYEYPSVEQTITAATNANPVQVTFSSGVGAYANGKNLVFLTGGTGNWTALNGLKVATIIDSTHATLQDYNPSTWALTNINSTSFGTFSGQSVNKLTQILTTSRCILIQRGPGPYTIDNNYLQAQYTSIFLGGAGTTWLNPANNVTVTGVTDRTHVTLSGVGNLAVGNLIAFSAVQDQTISGATAGSPTSLTVQTHSFPTGTNFTPEGCISVSGFTGTWAAVNGDWGSNGNGCGSGQATVIDSTHISIPVNSTGFGAVTGSGMKWIWTTKGNPRPTISDPPHDQWVVGHVTAISGLNVTYEWWGHQPQNTDGNGAGILVTNGATAAFNGDVLNNVTVTHNTLALNGDWVRLFRDIANTGDALASFGKGFWESKMGNNVLIEGNVFDLEGSILSPKTGVGSMSLNQANQGGGTPWVSLNNWTIRSNLFKQCGYIPLGLVEEYESGISSSGLVFTNNLATITGAGWLFLNGTADATITHNTIRNVGGGVLNYNWIFFIAGVNSNSIVKDNVANWLNYGYDIVGGFTWTPTTLTHNYLIDYFGVSFSPPTGDVRVATDAAMGFVNVASADAGGDYHGLQLTSGSVGHNAATDGTDVGVNFATLDAALAGGGGTSTSYCRWNTIPPCQ